MDNKQAIGILYNLIQKVRDKNSEEDYETALHVAIHALCKPDIIYCHECVESEQDTLFHDYWCHGQKVWRYHFCSCGRRVERKTNG